MNAMPKHIPMEVIFPEVVDVLVKIVVKTSVANLRVIRCVIFVTVVVVVLVVVVLIFLINL